MQRHPGGRSPLDIRFAISSAMITSRRRKCTSASISARAPASSGVRPLRPQGGASFGPRFRADCGAGRHRYAALPSLGGPVQWPSHAVTPCSGRSDKKSVTIMIKSVYVESAVRARQPVPPGLGIQQHGESEVGTGSSCQTAGRPRAVPGMMGGGSGVSGHRRVAHGGARRARRPAARRILHVRLVPVPGEAADHADRRDAVCLSHGRRT